MTQQFLKTGLPRGNQTTGRMWQSWMEKPRQSTTQHWLRFLTWSLLLLPPQSAIQSCHCQPPQSCLCFALRSCRHTSLSGQLSVCLSSHVTAWLFRWCATLIATMEVRLDTPPFVF